MIALGPALALLAAQRAGLIKPICTILMRRGDVVVDNFGNCCDCNWCNFDKRHHNWRKHNDCADGFGNRAFSDRARVAMQTHPSSPFTINRFGIVITVFTTLTRGTMLSARFLAPVYRGSCRSWERRSNRLEHNFIHMRMRIMTISDGCNTIRLDPAFRVQRAQASFHNAFRVDTVAVGLESHLRVLHRNLVWRVWR